MSKLSSLLQFLAIGGKPSDYPLPEQEKTDILDWVASMFGHKIPKYACPNCAMKRILEEIRLNQDKSSVDKWNLVMLRLGCKNE